MMNIYIRQIVIAYLLLTGLTLNAQTQPVSGPYKPTLTLSTGHTAMVNSAQFSPDGKLVVTSSIDGTAKVWDTRSGKLLRNLIGHSSPVRSAHFSPDGIRIITVGEKGSISWDAQTGQLLHRLEGHVGPANSSFFNVDGTKIVTARDSMAIVWEASTGNVLHRLAGHLGAVNSAQFSPDGTQIVTANQEGAAIVWDAGTGKLIYRLVGHSFYAQFAQFSPDGTQIVTAGDSTAILWNANTGELLFRLHGHDNGVRFTQFSPDGTQIVIGSENGACIVWDVYTGEVLQRLDRHGNSVYSAQYSPDGSRIITTGWDSIANVWNANTGELLFSLLGHEYKVLFAQFSADGNQIVTAGDLNAILWDANNGKLICRLAGHSQITMAAQFSQNGTKMVTKCRDSIATVWDVTTGKIIHQLNGHAQTLNSAQFSPDGTQVITACWDSTANVWDANTGRLLYRLDEHTSGVMFAQFSQSGTKIVTISWDSTAAVWEATTGNLISHLVEQDHFTLSAQFSPDETRVFASNLHGSAIVWDINTGELICRFDGFNDFMYGFPAQFSPDGKRIVTASRNTIATVWDVNTGEMLHQLVGHDKDLLSAQFSPDGKKIVTVSEEVTIVWDTETGKILSRFYGHNDPEGYLPAQFSPDGRKILAAKTGKLWDVHSGNLIFNLTPQPAVRMAQFNPDGKLILLLLQDGSIAFWSAETGEELARLYAYEGYNWAALHPSGLFDASPGAMQWMYYVIGLEAIELEQLKERYYEPGLFEKLMGYSDEPLRSVEGMDSIPLYPAVRIALDSLTHQLQIQLTPSNGGLGKVTVSINTKEVIEDANPVRGFERKRDTSLIVDLALYHRYFLKDSLNTVSVHAYNEAGWLKSPAQTVACRLRFAHAKGHETSEAPSFSFIPVSDPALYAIIAGTANYAGNKLDLKFPGKDATAMAQAIQQAGRQLFEDRVHIHLFSTDTADVNMHPSRPNIKAAFDDFKERAKAEDILLVYLSGHGVTYGDAEQAQFYYLTQDISSEDLSDEGVRRTRAISSAELTRWINAIPAQKQVMILDACNSGKAVESLNAGAKNLNSSQIRALDRMKDRTGMYVLAGSAADKVSYEASQYGQGLLTYSILEGMRGPALKDGQFIDIIRLFEHARDQVPQLAKNIGGVQNPTLATPGGGGFDIGIVNENVHIPLSNPKPVFIRNNFMNEETFLDELNISASLADYFSGITAKGPSAEVVYVDIDHFQSAYALRGLYRIMGEAVEVRVRLYQGKTLVGEEFTVNGKKDAPSLLAEGILKLTLKRLNSHNTQ